MLDSLFSRRYGLDEEEEGEGEDKAEEEEEEDRRAFYRSDSRLPGAPGCASSPQVLQQMGNTAFRKNDHEEAIRCFDEAILQCSRGNGPAESLLVALYSNRSAVLCAIHRYEEALADADQAVELNPTWSRGHSRRGNGCTPWRRGALRLRMPREKRTRERCSSTRRIRSFDAPSMA